MCERIYVDFNTMSQDLGSGERRVWIHPDHVQATFRAGMRVKRFDAELEVEATLDHADAFQG